MLSRRNRLITVFVIAWTLVFHYESLRASYVSPLAGRTLPKLPLLFPPAGWIMFFSVDQSYGFAEVYGMRNGSPVSLNPHDIFRTKAVGYDNIRRNVLVSVLSPSLAASFCPYLKRTFPGDEAFAVVYAAYPDVAAESDRVVRQLAYRCP